MLLQSLFHQILQLACGITTIHANANLSHLCIGYYHLLFVHVWCNPGPAFASDVCATAWLSVLVGKHPTVFGNDIDTGVKPTEDVFSTDLSTFFTWWSHVNTAMTRIYVYFTITITIGRCQIFILKKPRFDKIFQIKPRHPDGLKKTQIWVEKHSNVWPGADVASGSTPIFYGVAGYFCSYCINCSVAALRVVFCSGLLTWSADNLCSLQWHIVQQRLRRVRVE